MGSSGWGMWYGGTGGVAEWRGVYARHRLDISVGDVFFGVLSCGRRLRREKLEAGALRLCSLEEEGLVCLSVRSGWDLWLRAQGLRAGDEVLVSAVTHPDMIRIIHAHGLRAVPVDIDPGTLAVRPWTLEAALDARGGPDAAHAGCPGGAPFRWAYGSWWYSEVREGSRPAPHRGLRPGLPGAEEDGRCGGRRLHVQFRHPQDLDRARRRGTARKRRGGAK
jgi:DegT/DnrJ/EryC1/StrS aminotransferase family